MLTDPLQFLRLVIFRVSTLLTGGVVAFCYMIYSQTRGKSLPAEAFLALITAGFFWACFQVWREEAAKIRVFESKQPDFVYEPEGTKIGGARARIDEELGRPVYDIEFQIRFANQGTAVAYNVSLESFGCWINDDPPFAAGIDRIESVSKTPIGGHLAARFVVTRPARRHNGELSIPGTDLLVMLFQIRSRSSSSDGTVCENEPIWLTWDPRVHAVLGPAKPEEVKKAKVVLTG